MLQAAVAQDMDILRFGVQLIELVPGLKWLALSGCLEEFATLLEQQLDLRNEARNLATFRRHFRHYWWEAFSFRALLAGMSTGIEPKMHVDCANVHGAQRAAAWCSLPLCVTGARRMFSSSHSYKACLSPRLVATFFILVSWKQKKKQLKQSDEAIHL